MTKNVAERYEDLKEYGNIIVDYDEILLFYPDYYKTKIELENIRFISKEDADKYFEEHYRNSDLYKKLTKLAMAEDEIYSFMKQNKDYNHSNMSIILKKLIDSSIELCELIDYIGHYPATYPVPTEDEKNLKMEALLEKFDIMIRYHLDDELDKMQITSDDIVRVIETLKRNLKYIDTIISQTNTNDWLLTRKFSQEKNTELTNQIISEIDTFPLSFYQRKNNSKRDEGKKCLRLQYGQNII
jgi:hypothetical protein